MTDVTVVVVTHQSANVLDGCLDALAPAFDGVGHDVVVVDNASVDDSVRRARTHGALVVELGRNAGYAAGINAGLAAAPPTPAHVVLNPDVRLHPGAGRLLVEALDDPQVGIAAPRLLDADGRPSTSFHHRPSIPRAAAAAALGGRLAARAGLGEAIRPGSRAEHRAAWATGAALAVSRRCADVVGPWDESFFLYSEETDHALRARDAGFALRFVADAEATHLGGESRTVPTLWALLTYNRVALYRRRHGRLAATAFRAVVAVEQASRACVGSARHRAGLAAVARPSRFA